MHRRNHCNNMSNFFMPARKQKIPRIEVTRFGQKLFGSCAIRFKDYRFVAEGSHVCPKSSKIVFIPNGKKLTKLSENFYPLPILGIKMGGVVWNLTFILTKSYLDEKFGWKFLTEKFCFSRNFQSWETNSG